MGLGPRRLLQSRSVGRGLGWRLSATLCLVSPATTLLCRPSGIRRQLGLSAAQLPASLPGESASLPSAGESWVSARDSWLSAGNSWLSTGPAKHSTGSTGLSRQSTESAERESTESGSAKYSAGSTWKSWYWKSWRTTARRHSSAGHNATEWNSALAWRQQTERSTDQTCSHAEAVTADSTCAATTSSLQSEQTSATITTRKLWRGPSARTAPPRGRQSEPALGVPVVFVTSRGTRHGRSCTRLFCPVGS
jgi:hypothetical protein